MKQEGNLKIWDLVGWTGEKGFVTTEQGWLRIPFYEI